jgi:hypothetical protein
MGLLCKREPIHSENLRHPGGLDLHFRPVWSQRTVSLVSPLAMYVSDRGSEQDLFRPSQQPPPYAGYARGACVQVAW